MRNRPKQPERVVRKTLPLPVWPPILEVAPIAVPSEALVGADVFAPVPTLAAGPPPALQKL